MRCLPFGHFVHQSEEKNNNNQVLDIFILRYWIRWLCSCCPEMPETTVVMTYSWGHYKHAVTMSMAHVVFTWKLYKTVQQKMSVCMLGTWWYDYKRMDIRDVDILLENSPGDHEQEVFRPRGRLTEDLKEAGEPLYAFNYRMKLILWRFSSLLLLWVASKVLAFPQLNHKTLRPNLIRCPDCTTCSRDTTDISVI